jgi:hypothetical protein
MIYFGADELFQHLVSRSANSFEYLGCIFITYMITLSRNLLLTPYFVIIE